MIVFNLAYGLFFTIELLPHYLLFNRLFILPRILPDSSATIRYVLSLRNRSLKSATTDWPDQPTQPNRTMVRSIGPTELLASSSFPSGCSFIAPLNSNIYGPAGAAATTASGRSLLVCQRQSDTRLCLVVSVGNFKGRCRGIRQGIYGDDDGQCAIHITKTEHTQNGIPSS